MLKHILLVGALATFLGCGGNPSSSNSTSSSSSSSSSSASSSSASTSSSTSSSSSGVISVGFCPNDNERFAEQAQLQVISRELYRDKLQAIMSEKDAATFSYAITQYTGNQLFNSDAPEQIIHLATETFYRNAEAIAAQYSTVDCENKNHQECADVFISDFVEPLYDSPLTDAEVAAYHTLFEASIDPDTEGQHQATVMALSSPRFLFQHVVATDE